MKTYAGIDLHSSKKRGKGVKSAFDFTFGILLGSIVNIKR